MAVEISQIVEHLQNAGIHHELHEVTKEPVIFFQTNNYVNVQGTNVLMVVIQVTERGEYLKFFAPSAYYIPEDETAYAVLKTFAIIAWRVKLVDFEVDPTDGEVRPTIDFPVEDAKVTQEQVVRCCKTLSRVVDLMDKYIRHAILYQTVHFALLQDNVHELAQSIPEEELPTEEELIAKLRQIQRNQTTTQPTAEPTPTEEESSEDSSSTDEDWI